MTNSLVLQMLFSELYTIMVNKVTSSVLGGAIVSITPPGFAPADTYGLDVTCVQSCLLEFSVKAHP